MTQARLEGNVNNICSALLQLAHLHFRQGNYQQTRLLANEVLEIRRKLLLQIVMLCESLETVLRKSENPPQPKSITISRSTWRAN